LKIKTSTPESKISIFSKLSVLSSLSQTANFLFSLVISKLSFKSFSTFSISDFSKTLVFSLFQGI
jgi:hypothetical protein